MQAHKPSRRIGLIFSVVLVVSLLVVALRWQSIFDWWRLRDYTPPAAIAQLATDTTMTPKAEHLFYVFHPQLDDRQTFNQNCPTYEKTIVLGCYVTNKGIYLYDIQDDRLQGVEQVTAAHEMLHVAYQRLSRGERTRVDALLQEAYAQVTDERIRAIIESYKQEGADVNNELHSILGTEVADLPPALEEYYRQYFADRAVVVQYAMTYEREFSLRQKQVEDYDAQLAGLKIQIETNQQELDRQATAIEQERRRLDALLSSQSYTAYNAGVASFNAQVQQYNVLVSTTQSQIEQYNEMVAKRNAIAVEEQDLAKSLDSRPQTQQTE